MVSFRNIGSELPLYNNIDNQGVGMRVVIQGFQRALGCEIHILSSQIGFPDCHMGKQILNYNIYTLLTVTPALVITELDYYSSLYMG